MTDMLAGQRALVTGGASGIGRAIAVALAKHGATVAIVDRGDAAGTVATITAAGGQASAATIDVADEGQVLAFFAAELPRLGGLELLYNCAGILIEKSLLDTSAADFDRLVGVNLRGTFLMGREALRVMAKQRRGRVINIASELAYLGREQASIYCATKGAVLSLTRSWAREFAPDVLVNAIAPGPIDTPMLNKAALSPEALAKETANPLARVGSPDEIVPAALFLADPANSFMTGQCLSPNGGAVMV